MMKMQRMHMSYHVAGIVHPNVDPHLTPVGLHLPETMPVKTNINEQTLMNKH